MQYDNVVWRVGALHITVVVALILDKVEHVPTLSAFTVSPFWEHESVYECLEFAP